MSGIASRSGPSANLRNLLKRQAARQNSFTWSYSPSSRKGSRTAGHPCAKTRRRLGRSLLARQRTFPTGEMGGERNSAQRPLATAWRQHRKLDQRRKVAVQASKGPAPGTAACRLDANGENRLEADVYAPLCDCDNADVQRGTLDGHQPAIDRSLTLLQAFSDLETLPGNRHSRPQFHVDR